MSHVVILDTKSEAEIELWQRLAKPMGLEVSALSEVNDEALSGLLKDADAVIVQKRPLTTELIKAAPELKIVQKMSNRRDKIDVNTAKEQDVAVALMPMQGCIAVSEHVFSLMLACAKKTVLGHHYTVTGAYRDMGVEPKVTTERSHGFQWMKIPNLEELNGLTLGICGFGEIGNEVAKRANAFNMKVVYYDLNRLDEDLEEELCVTYADKDDLLKQSDFVTIHMPLNEHTEGFISSHELEIMKPTAYLINCSRGGTVDEEAFVKAMQEKQIAGAGFDVFVLEPIPFDHPYLSLENVTYSPHIGGGKGGARERQPRSVLENIRKFLNGEKPENRIC
ncbi:MAG: hypothetical protein JEZ06_06675 [Anaerolineaceae bacterium]|nr:hypothetical protein [Anaerolineaceae bacterium]